jgi:hypothetical protein
MDCARITMLGPCRYPVESVATMRTIIDAAEQWMDKNPSIVENIFHLVYSVSADFTPLSEGLERGCWFSMCP